MQFQVKLIIFTYLKTEDSLASKVHFCGLDLQTTSLCVRGPWVWIPSGTQIFTVPSYGWFFTSPFISIIIYYTPWHWLVGWRLLPGWDISWYWCDCVMQLSLNVLLVMDCVTARCGSQVQPTKMTLAHQRVLSSSEVRASDAYKLFFTLCLISSLYILHNTSHQLTINTPLTFDSHVM